MSQDNENNKENIIKFSAAMVYARSIKKSEKLFNVWNIHRAQGAKLDTGILVIEKHWFKT